MKYVVDHPQHWYCIISSMLEIIILPNVHNPMEPACKKGRLQGIDPGEDTLLHKTMEY